MCRLNKHNSDSDSDSDHGCPLGHFASINFRYVLNRDIILFCMMLIRSQSLECGI